MTVWATSAVKTFNDPTATLAGVFTTADAEQGLVPRLRQGQPPPADFPLPGYMLVTTTVQYATGGGISIY